MEPENTQAEETPNPENTNDSPTSEGNGQEPERLYAGKYKSIEELEEGYKSTSGEASKMAEKLKEAENTLHDFQPIVQVVLQDEELRKGVETKLGYHQEDNSKKDEATTSPGRDPQVAAVAEQMQNMIVDNFMTKHDLDKLDDDEQTQVKRDVGKYLQEMVDPASINLNKLPRQLENAYKLYLADKGDDREEGENLSSEIGKTKGAPSTTPKGNTMPSLTQQEKDAAKKMGISEADFAKSKQAILEQ